MKLIISTQAFNSLISKIQNVVSPKPPIPILANFLIEARGEEVVLTATDLTVSIRCSAEATVLEPGATTLPAKRAAQLVRELTTAQLEISSNERGITTLVSGTSRFKLNGMRCEEFPPLHDLSQATSFQIPQRVLKDLLYRTAFTVSREDNRYVLTGLFLHLAERQATFIGTDGKRLARAHALVEGDPTLTYRAIIPLKAVEEILKNLADEDGAVTLSMMHDRLAIAHTSFFLLTKLLMGEYPDVSRVIPDRSDAIISLQRDELMTLLRQVSLFAGEHNHSVRFTFEEGELRLTANSMDVGEGHVVMPIGYPGKKLEIAFNPGFFVDILRRCKSEYVTLGLTDAYNPGILTDGSPTSSLAQSSPLFVLMPMRLSSD